MRIGFDFDGVLSLTPFGRLAVHAPKPVAPLPINYELFYDAPAYGNPLRLGIEYLRYAWRRSAPEGPAVLRELAAAHEVYIVTGRSAVGVDVLRRWLRRHSLDDVVRDVRMAPAGLRPPQHKLAVAKMLGIDVHIDDDPRTAYHLAQSGIARVFLLDHANAHGDAPVPDRLTLVSSLRDFAAHIARIGA